VCAQSWSIRTGWGLGKSWGDVDVIANYFGNEGRTSSGTLASSAAYLKASNYHAPGLRVCCSDIWDIVTVAHCSQLFRIYPKLSSQGPVRLYSAVLAFALTGLNPSKTIKCRTRIDEIIFRCLTSWVSTQLSSSWRHDLRKTQTKLEHLSKMH